MCVYIYILRRKNLGCVKKSSGLVAIKASNDNGITLTAGGFMNFFKMIIIKTQIIQNLIKKKNFIY